MHIDYSYNDTILSIKNKIKTIKNYPVEIQNLYFESNLLEDNEKISDIEFKYNLFILKELNLTLKEQIIKFKNSKSNECFDIKVSPLMTLEEFKKQIYEKTHLISELQLFQINKNIPLENQIIEFISLNEESSLLFSLLENKIITKNEISDIIENLFNEYNTKHKIEHYKQLPLYISNEENELDYKIICNPSKINNIPVIIINDKKFNNFINILKNVVKYQKYKDIEILNDKFIISNKNSIQQYHINNQNQELFAECKMISEIYTEKEYEIFRSKLKEQLPPNIELNDFIEDWVRTVFNIISEFLLFVLRKRPLYFYCKKCKFPNIFIKSVKNNNDNQINVNNEYEGKKNIISKYFSFGIANLLIDCMNYDNSKMIKFNKLINKILNQQSNNININNNISLGNPPKKNNGPNNNIGKNINIIYYDENNKKERTIPVIFTDSKLFERVIPFGVFILVTDKKRLNIVLEEIKKNNKDMSDFYLIVSGSNCESFIKLLDEKKLNIFKSGCIYTTNLKKYQQLEKKYDIIENVCTEEDEILSFINEHKSNTDIFKTYKLININNYMDNYYNFHKIISNQYNTEILENENEFENSIALLQDINCSIDLDIVTLQEILKTLKNGDIRKNMIKEYTEDTIYNYFNRWLNELDFIAYKKISYFIALLMYGLNDYKGEKKGLKKNIKLFRGLKMSYINLSFYERNIGNIITFPSLTSCSTEKKIAKNFCGRGEREDFYPISKRKEDGIFSVLFIIDYKYKKDWVPTAFSVKDISYYNYEEECIFQPFSFYKLQKTEIDLDKYEADIYLTNIGKTKILENCIKNNKIIKYNEKENIMIENEEKEYSEEINKVLQKYPLSLSTNLAYDNDDEEMKNTENI